MGRHVSFGDDFAGLFDWFATRAFRLETLDQYAVGYEEEAVRRFLAGQPVVQRFVRRRTFEGDNGLRLSVPAEFFEQMISPADAPGTDPGLRRFIIETRKWKEI